MIIPVRCFTCGEVLGDKYNYYLKKVKEMKTSMGELDNTDRNKIVYLEIGNVKKTPEGKVLDELNLTEMCCRRHFLTHVDIE